MGQAQGKYEEAEIELICKQTGIDRASLHEWYQNLVSKKKLSKKDFVTAYHQFFPEYVRKTVLVFLGTFYCYKFQGHICWSSR